MTANNMAKHAKSSYLTGIYKFDMKHLFTQNCKYINPLTPNDHFSGHTAPLTSKRCILYIYSTNIGTEYFNPLNAKLNSICHLLVLLEARLILHISRIRVKHGIYSPFFPLQNAVCFIILTYLVPVLFTFYIQSVLKFKK